MGCPLERRSPEGLRSRTFCDVVLLGSGFGGLLVLVEVALETPHMQSVEDVNQLIWLEVLVFSVRRQQRNLRVVDANEIVAVIADAHVGWLAHFTARFALDASQDAFG